ncbi:uncharacterized protein METZ01_LOCUS263269, partial [marine metagenome]
MGLLSFVMGRDLFDIRLSAQRNPRLSWGIVDL